MHSWWRLEAQTFTGCCRTCINIAGAAQAPVGNNCMRVYISNGWSRFRPEFLTVTLAVGPRLKLTQEPINSSILVDTAPSSQPATSTEAVPPAWSPRLEICQVKPAYCSQRCSVLPVPRAGHSRFFLARRMTLLLFNASTKHMNRETVTSWFSGDSVGYYLPRHRHCR